MKIKFYTLMLLLFLPLGVSAKLDEPTKARLMNEANSLFNLGEYEKARETYKQVYIEDGDAVSDAQIEKCDQCMDLIKTAMADVIKGDYEAAVNSYQEVMKINPADMKVQQQIIDCRKRQYEPKLKLAQQLYREGKYEQAKDTLAEYTSLTGNTDPALLSNITEAITLSQEAKFALNRNDLQTAKSYYNRLIEKNPTDVLSANAIAEINTKTQKVKVVYDTPKKSLRPLKNKFNMFVYTGFSNPVGFGGGIGYNFSYFNLTIDGGGSVGQEGIEDDKLYNDKIKNCVKLDDGTYVQGKMQLAITPGINLKYFIIGVGLGTMMTKELSDTKQSIYGDYLDGTQTNGSHFLIRPTITGYIPFDKDFSGGFSIMAGYNIVSGVSGLNQFILGIGFFF